MRTMLLLPVLALAVLPRAAAADEPAPRLTARTASLTVKVVHPVAARQAMVAAARDAGGFAVLVTDQQLRLKVPPARLDEVLPQLASHGIVLEKSLGRADLTESIAQKEARLKSREEILQRLRRFLDDSNVAATLQIEKNMTTLVSELEQLKGQLRVERERAAWAVIDVAFRFARRDRVIYVRSPFEWLNTVDLQRFVTEF